MDASGKFGEHERSARVARGAAESKSSFFFLAGLVEMSAIPFWYRYDRFYCHIGVNFTFGLQDCDRHISDIVKLRIVKPGFCSIHFTVTLARLKNVNRYIANIVLSKIFISEFHCILLLDNIISLGFSTIFSIWVLIINNQLIIFFFIKSSYHQINNQGVFHIKVLAKRV